MAEASQAPRDIESFGGWNRFESTFSGDVVRPAAAEYEKARRIWNGDIDRQPLAVLRPAALPDVVSAVLFAREAELPTAVRCGGHSYPGHSTCDNGLVIDLSRLNQVDLDPDHRIVRAGGGSLLRNVDRATTAHGQVVPAGIVSHTGLGGLALGGGIGWLTRSFGLTCDQFQSLEVVTADGEVVCASDEENPDLLWGLQGGGGNFGVVTRFELRTHELGEVWAGHLTYPMSQAVEVVTRVGELIADGPRTMGAFVTMGIDPRLAGMETPDGSFLLRISVVHRGDESDDALREIRSVGRPLSDTVARAAFSEWQGQLDDEAFHGNGWYMKSGHTEALSEALVAQMAENTLTYRGVASPHVDRVVIGFQAIGGAANDVAEDDTAYSGRQAQWHCAMEVGFVTPEERDRIVGWCRDVWDKTEPLLDLKTSYVNMLTEEAPSSLAGVYGDAKLARLRSLKAKYDPTNFFHFNANILPSPRAQHGQE